MVPVKRWVTGLQIALALAPAGVALLSIRMDSPPVAIAAVVLVFAVVALLPLCKGRQSLWIFFSLFLTVTPINIRLITVLLRWAPFAESLWLTNILRGTLLYMVALSVEELIAGYIARHIWRRQYKPLFTR